MLFRVPYCGEKWKSHDKALEIEGGEDGGKKVMRWLISLEFNETQSR